MENLDLYERLQKVFMEKMGPEQIGDRIYDTLDNMVGFISSIDGNRLDYITSDGNAYWTKKREVDRLPLPIDPVNPERGLWGMVDWDRWECIPTQPDGRMTMYCNGRWKFTALPTKALLRALCEQEGC